LCLSDNPEFKLIFFVSTIFRPASRIAFIHQEKEIAKTRNAECIQAFSLRE
jgi:hypothetical protein